MGSRFHHRSFGNIHILGVVLGALVLLACPNPNKHVWFEDGSQLVEEYIFDRLGGKAAISLKSFSTFAGWCERYSLALDIKLYFQRDVRDFMLFRPENVAVLLNGVPMNSPARYPPRKIADTSLARKGRFNVYIHYDLDLTLHEEVRTELLSGEALRLEIIMDKFLYFKGDRIPFDTVYARETQPCPY